MLSDVDEETVLKEYADFLDQVKRTIYIDNLSPQVTDKVIKAALDQCANVVRIEFITNYTIPFHIPSAALVEMESEKHAIAALDLMNDFPFMMSGMPRPVRARRAKPEMFSDRPPNPHRKLSFRFVEPDDPEAERVKKLKGLARMQEKENMTLIKFQLEDEAKLAEQQQETLDTNCEKYNMVEKAMRDGLVQKLACRYGVRFSDN